MQGPPPIGALLFMASAAHEVFKGVNLIDHVSLDEGYVFSGMGGFGWVGIRTALEVKQVRYVHSNVLNKA